MMKVSRKFSLIQSETRSSRHLPVEQNRVAAGPAPSRAVPQFVPFEERPEEPKQSGIVFIVPSLKTYRCFRVQQPNPR